ncbi:MAG: DUF5655 domain-containing protein [Terriglobia bacterium]
MKKRRVWRCPKCRRWLPERNAVHACTPPVPLAVHFRGKKPRVRQLYRSVRAALKEIGPVKMDSTKSRVAFRVWTNFLELTPQKNGLRGHLVLPRRVRDPSTVAQDGERKSNHARFFDVFSSSPRIHYHYFKLTEPSQLDRRFRRLLAEAYRVIGRRKHLRRPLDRRAENSGGSVSPRQGPFDSAQDRPGGSGGFRFPRLRSGRAGQASGLSGLRSTAKRKTTKKRPLWRCPRCGWQFVTRNLWHSCVRIPLAKHFQGKDAIVRKTFDALVAALRKNGPLTVVTSKTRITLMVRMRFMSVTPQKDTLRGGFGLMRPGVRHLRLRPGSRYGRIYGYRFRLTHPKQIDRRFRRLLAEAYRVGQQKHLRRG